MLAISSSIWINFPPTLGNSRAIYSAISVEGVIGYPAKNLTPAAIAPAPQASLPNIKALWDAAFIMTQSSDTRPLVTGERKIQPFL
jgi:hypothetical protein